jgi:hypothetical protein
MPLKADRLEGIAPDLGHLSLGICSPLNMLPRAQLLPVYPSCVTILLLHGHFSVPKPLLKEAQPQKHALPAAVRDLHSRPRGHACVCSPWHVLKLGFFLLLLPCRCTVLNRLSYVCTCVSPFCVVCTCVSLVCARAYLLEVASHLRTAMTKGGSFKNSFPERRSAGSPRR